MLVLRRFECRDIRQVIGIPPQKPFGLKGPAIRPLCRLMKAANAIFGEDTERARRWHEKLRFKLRVEGDGAERAVRSLIRYRAQIRRGSARGRWSGYFMNHCDRMRYSDYMQRGLPIGSGPVEAAAKTIIQARMRRSGMRWSQRGGQQILDLRAHLKSGCWDVMWSALKTAAVAA